MTDTLLGSFATATVYLFLPSVPVTHALGLVAHLPRRAKAKHVLLYPVKGGRTHLIFEIISWAAWGASVLVAFPVLVRQPFGLSKSRIELLTSAAAVGGVFSELFMIKSLLVFEPAAPATRRTGSDPGSPAFNRSLVPPPLAAFAIVAMGVLWSIMGAALLLATDTMEDTTAKHVHFALSGMCVLVGALTTHGLGGQLRHKPLAKDLSEQASAWRFWQPFQGGKAFVASQALGWALFSSALASLVWVVVQAAQGIAYCVMCWAVMTSSVMLAAQLVLAVSVFIFKRKELTESVSRTINLASAASLQQLASVWLPILMFYTPVHIFTTVVVTSFLLLPVNYAAALWVGSLTVYYLITGTGEPEHTGRREWPWLQQWLLVHLEPALEAWFGQVEVVYEGTSKLTMAQKYVFGYHPHGLFPIGAPYLRLLKDFSQLFPAISPTPLIASVCFYTPVIRDFCSWCGVRQVARKTFVRALRETGSVILVPGGQAELLHTWRLFRRKEFVIHCRHKGFIRVAAEEGASLVPVAVLGEASTLRNLIDLPWMQLWTYKRLGFPVPYLLVGRWGLTPFPRQTCLRFVIGDPIPIPAHARRGQADEAAIDALHRQYFDAVEALLVKHMPTFPGYQNLKLIMIR